MSTGSSRDVGIGPKGKAQAGSLDRERPPAGAADSASAASLRCCCCEARATQRLSLRLGSEVAAVLLVCADHAACARQPGAWGLLSDPLVGAWPTPQEDA